MRKSERLKISYVPQSTAGLNGFLSEYIERNLLDESLFKAILRKFDFPREQFEKQFCNVSTEDLGLKTEEEKKEAEEKAEELKGLLTFVKESLGEQVKEVKLSSDLGSHPVCKLPLRHILFTAKL